MSTASRGAVGGIGLIEERELARETLRVGMLAARARAAARREAGLSSCSSWSDSSAPVCFLLRCSGWKETLGCLLPPAYGTFSSGCSDETRFSPSYTVCSESTCSIESSERSDEATLADLLRLNMTRLAVSMRPAQRSLKGAGGSFSRFSGLKSSAHTFWSVNHAIRTCRWEGSPCAVLVGT